MAFRVRRRGSVSTRSRVWRTSAAIGGTSILFMGIVLLGILAWNAVNP